MLEQCRFIAIEGPIGVGKTFLAKAIAHRLGARLVLEPADKNPLLERFYADMPRYALATQLVFLVSRYQQQVELTRRYLFHPLAVSDYIFARDRIFAGLTLSEHDLVLYNQLYEILVTRAAVPDIVVLLQADVDTLLARIQQRRIPYEANLAREYIERLVVAYDDYFRGYSASPLLVVDTSSLDYSKGGLDPDEVIAEIVETGSGRRRWTPRTRRAAGSG